MAVAGDIIFRFHRLFPTLLLVLGALLGSGQMMWAHGGGTPQLMNEPVGPYLLSVWTNPDPAVVGELHVTVGLALASTGEAVTEPAVVITASSQNDNSALAKTDATHEGALTPYFYEADLNFPSSGVWRVEIVVESVEGKGAAGFSLDVRDKGMNWTLIGAFGVVAVVALWLGWMVLRGGNRRAQRQ